MKNFAPILAVLPLVALSASVLAQAPVTSPAFEVASIRSNNGGGNKIEVTPGRLTATSATLLTCIRWAYGFQDRQISGANSLATNLLTSERYDIVATSARPVSESQLKLMLQTLLAERFHLEFHKQTKEIATYTLLVEKNGAKFQQSEGEGDYQQQAKGKLARQWKRITMAQFAENIADAMQSPVLDQTGLSARYDLSLDLTPYLPTTDERPDIASMMLAAIREQLGLKMEAHKAAVEVMIVDRLEKPAAN
jgi:uncharacterized protein (TIGR03435 family)